MAKKYLGQHFLYDPSLLQKIIVAADLDPADTVVEIGPGTGRLTGLLAEKVKKVVAIELDGTLYKKLKSSLLLNDNVELIHEDALKFPFESINEFKVVSNIPYYITTPLIFRLLEAKQKLRTMTLTIQKEVAERIIAKPGKRDYGVLSVMVQYRASPELKFIIRKESFKPAPRVDSAVVHMRILDRPSVAVDNEQFFFRVVKTAFLQRRKMLGNTLKGLSEDIGEILIACGIDPKRRPETLSIEEFARVAGCLAATNKKK